MSKGDEMAKPRVVQIVPSDNEGVFVHVGCKILVFSCAALALEALKRYYDDPEGVEKEYLGRYKWAEQPSAPHFQLPGIGGIGLREPYTADTSDSPRESLRAGLGDPRR
jgi:hypothetical protein